MKNKTDQNCCTGMGTHPESRASPKIDSFMFSLGVSLESGSN